MKNNDLLLMLESKDEESCYLGMSMIMYGNIKLDKKTKKVYENIDLIGKIKTYSDVCKYINEEETSHKYDRIKQIEKCFNQGWKLDWSNQKEYKYYPYFSVLSSGGLVFFAVHVDYRSHFFGGVSYFKTKEIAEYVGKTFIKEYQNLSDNC